MDKDKVVIGGKYRLLNYEEAQAMENKADSIIPDMKSFFNDGDIVKVTVITESKVFADFPDGDNWALDFRWLLPLKKEVSSKILGEDKPKIRFIRR